MAEGMAAVDTHGMPYPLLPGDLTGDTERHHAWYRSTAPELATPAGHMLRIGRLYRVNAEDHDVIHDELINGVESFPPTEDAKIELGIPVLAGYLAREGISPDNLYDPVPIDDETYEFMRSRRYMHIEKNQNASGIFTDTISREEIRTFLLDLVLSRGLENVKPTAISAFLKKHGDVGLHTAGRIVLASAITSAIVPLGGKYKAMFEEGLLVSPLPNARMFVGEWLMPMDWRELQARVLAAHTEAPYTPYVAPELADALAG